MIIEPFSYENPISGAGGIQGTVTLDLKKSRDRSGAEAFIIESNLGARVVVARQAKLAVLGRSLDAPEGLVRTFLSAKFTTGTGLTVFDETGFSANHPVALVEDYDESTGLPTKVAYRAVASTGAGSITLNSDPGQTFVKGTMVCNLAGLEREFWFPLLFLEGIGAKAAAERPNPPTLVSVTPLSGPRRFRVVIANPHKSGQMKKLRFRIFCRPTAWSYPHAGWIPDRDDIEFGVTTNDATAATSKQDDDNISIDVSTQSGSTDALPDPTESGGEVPATPTNSLAAETPYFLAVVSYDLNSGARQLKKQNESIANAARYVTTA